MRNITLIGIVVLALSPLFGAQKPQSEGSSEVDNLPPYQKAFLNLPEERRNEWISYMNNAQRLANEQRIIEALEEIRKAERVFAEKPEIWFHRGSCYIRLRAFDKALDCYDKAKQIVGEKPIIAIHVGEVHFVTHQWQKAHDTFESLLEGLPAEAKDIRRMSEFKLMLSKLKLGKEQEAQILADKYDYLDDSPYHYYAKASLAYHQNNEEEANQWIQRAARIFIDPKIIEPWQDTLIEYGAIKSHYGNNQ